MYVCRSPGLGLTSSIVRAIEEDHVSTEDHLARPPGWDAVNYSCYDHIFEGWGYRIIRRTTPWPTPAYLRGLTKTTAKWTGGTPTETLFFLNNKMTVITRSEEQERMRNVKQAKYIPSKERKKYLKEQLFWKTSSELETYMS